MVLPNEPAVAPAEEERRLRRIMLAAAATAATGHWLLLLLLLLLLLRAMLDIPAWMVNQRRRRYTDDAGQYKTQLEQFLVGRYYDCTRACTRVVLLHGVVL